MKKEYQLTEQDLKDFFEATKPMPVMYMTYGEPFFRSPQERANDEWKRLGKKYGFKWDTVELTLGKGKEWITAESLRIASDGLPFDEDFIGGDPKPGEVEIIQFLRPSGRRRRMLADVGLELAEKAKDLIITSGQLTTGDIAIYVRRKGESDDNERLELADNGPGPNSPTEVLKRMILAEKP